MRRLPMRGASNYNWRSAACGARCG